MGDEFDNKEEGEFDAEGNPIKKPEGDEDVEEVAEEGDDQDADLPEEEEEM